ncbi:cadherin domain-containing protein [Rubritalea tangerina]|uniref:Cadherin domain-containing protein n=1 Tax=Rubritalea tangerina TaxID=430798 RepID=A0ABW4Z9V1_9BACT
MKKNHLVWGGGMAVLSLIGYGVSTYRPIQNVEQPNGAHQIVKQDQNAEAVDRLIRHIEAKAQEPELTEVQETAHQVETETQALIDAVKDGRPLELKVAGVQRTLLLSPKKVFSKEAKIRLADGSVFLDPSDGVHVFGGIVASDKVVIAEGVEGVVRVEGEEAAAMGASGMRPSELLASFDAKAVSMSVVGEQYTLAMRNAGRDRILLRNNPATGAIEMRYEPEALHKEAFGVCDCAGCGHPSHSNEAVGMEEAMAKVQPLDPELAARFDQWVEIDSVVAGLGIAPGESYQAINTTPGIDPLTGIGTKAADPIPFGEKYHESLMEFQYWAQTGPDLLPGDKENPTDADIASMLTRLLITFEEIDEIYERNMATKMLVGELMIRRENDGGPDKGTIMSSWRNGSESLVAHGNFYGWGGGGAAAGNSFNISSWTVGAAHELGHVLSMGHSDGGDLMGPGGGPAHFWSYLTPGPYSKPITAHQLWREFSGRAQLRTRGVKEHGQVDGESDTGLRTANGSNKLRHPAETPFANDDTVVTAVDTMVEFDPRGNDDRATPGSPYYNENIVIEEVSRMVPAGAGTLEITDMGKKLRFTPSAGFEGVVHFNYTLRGSVGNNDRGWLSRAPIAITVGTPSSVPNTVDIAAGQDQWTLFGSNLSVVDTPSMANIFVTGNRLLLRAHADATGSEQFTLNIGGTEQEVTVNYSSPNIQAVDDLVQSDGGRLLRFNPLVNDVVTGQLRNEWNISTVVKQSLDTATEKQTDFARSYVLTSASLDTPSMGSLELEKVFHIYPDGTTGNEPNGFLRFEPAAGASGYAVISYTAKDVDGRVLNGTARVLVGIADVVRPARPYTRVRQDHGVVLESVKIPASGGDFTGVSTLQWEVVNQPEGANVSFEGGNSENAVAFFDSPGRYRLRLNASDNGHTKTVEKWVIVEADPLKKNLGEERGPWATVNHRQLSGWNQGSWNTSELVSAVSDDKFVGLIDLAPAGTATRSDGNNAEAQSLVTPSEYHAFTQYYGNQNAEFGNKGSEAWWELDLGAEVPVQWVDVHLALSALEGSDYGRYGLVAKLLGSDRSEIQSQKLLPKSEHHFAHRIPVSIAGEQTVRYVRIEKPSALNTLALWEVRVMGYRGQDVDLTVMGTPSQSTTPNSDFDAYKAIDKLRGGINGSRTDTTTDGNWWELTLDQETPLSQVRLHLETAMSGGTVTAYDAAGTQTWQVSLDGNTAHLFDAIPANTLAKRVRVALPAGLTNASGDKAVRINECWVWGEKDHSTQTAWSQVSGPGAASFADASALHTNVTLASNGSYVLRLTSDDGWNKTVRDFVVDYDSGSTGPEGYGIADLDLGTAGGGQSVDLYAAFQDGETADNAMSYEVVSVSNAAIFDGDQTGAIADPANFSLSTLAGASGSSVVTVRATDGNGNSTDISFQVDVANRAPEVPGVLEVVVPELTPANTVVADLAQYVTDVDGDALTFTVHDDLINRRYASSLSLASDGKLSIIGDLPVVDSQYSAGTLIIEVSDGVNHIQKFSVQLTLEDENRAPDLVAETVAISETAVVGASFYQPSLGASNDPNESYTWEILSGNTSGDWSIDPASGALSPNVVMDAQRQASYSLVLQATDNGTPAKSASTTITINVGLQGILAEDYFAEIPGNTIADLTGSANYPDSPTSRSLVASNGFHFPSNGNEFGRRVRGYLTVPEDGDYVFHIASDDHGQFLLSTDTDAANAVSIVQLNGYTSELNFNATSSAAVSLIAGQKYYFEALHKEGGGGDHLAMGWSGPGGLDKTLIASEYFEPLDDSDADGLEDWWEQTYIGNLAAVGSEDTDQDGLTNAQELLVHTHPLISGRAQAWQQAIAGHASLDHSSIQPLAGNATRGVDLTGLSGDYTLEFFVNGEDLGQSGVDLLAGNGWGLKFEQWNNRGVMGITRFGYSDWSFSAEVGQSVATPYGALTHVVAVVDSQQGQTRLYYNGVHVGTLGQVPAFAGANVTLGSSNLRDDAENGVYAFAAYDSALSANTIIANHGAWLGNVAPVAQNIQVNIAEDSGAGSSLGSLLGLDYDNGDTLSYAIVAGNESGLFAIDSVTGALTANGGLDYESTSQHTLTVDVSDGSLTTSVTVTVMVTDANDAPALSGQTVVVGEGLAAGQVVASLVATDPDQSASLSYSITAGNGAGLFAVDPATGVITTTGPLDYESAAQHVLTVEVSDGSLTDTATVTVDVTNLTNLAAGDVIAVDLSTSGGSAANFNTIAASAGSVSNVLDYNDGQARDGVSVTLSVVNGLNDDPAAGSWGGTAADSYYVTAADDIAYSPNPISLTFSGLDDSLRYNLRVYDFLSGQDAVVETITVTDGAGTQQTVETRGNIWAAASLEDAGLVFSGLQTDGSGQIELSVSSAGGWSILNAAVLEVVSPNSAPQLDDVTFGIAENGAVNASVGTLVATDPDAGDVLSYTIVGGNASGSFSLDASTGALTTTSALDHESASQHVLTVEVSDGTLSDQASVTVNVADVNEAPVASDAVGDLAENLSGGQLIATVAASDPDAGSLLGFSITAGNGSGLFAIGANGEVTSTGVLDFESAGQHVLTVTVSDGALSDSAQVTVNVTDVNEAPVANDVVGSLAENSSAGSVVAVVGASDPDAGASLTYSITAGNGSGLFAIDGSGAVSTTDELDYEDVSQHVLTVTVSDGTLSDSAQVTVDVTDVNEDPVLVDSVVNVDENGVAGTAVTTLSATDPDAGASLSYSITAGNEAGLFALDSASGAITSTAELDFETSSQFVLSVEVSDGSLTDTAIVTIDVNDLNEEPEFVSDPMTRSALLANEAYSGETLAGAASDVDQNTTLSYSKISGPAWLVVGSDGSLSGTPSSSDIGTNTFTVGVDDGNGGTASATLNIDVLAYRITTSFPSYWSNFAWDRALDDDPAVFAWTSRRALVDDHFTVEYAEPVGPGVFEILTGDPSNGGDALSSGVMETSDDGTNWTSVATFSGGEAQATLASAVKFVRLRATAEQGQWLKIREFVEPTNADPVVDDATLLVSEDVSSGASVGTVTATDPNAGDTLSYAITAGNESNDFAIDANSGEITTAAALDYESVSQYVLTVTVTDDGVPSLNDSATITINVTNVNEGPTANDTSGSVAEDATLGTTVATVSASDPDAGDSLSYAITAGNTGGAFAIDNSGVITTATALDYETTNSYTLTVTVTDNGGLSDTASVAVSVTDVLEVTAAVVATGSASNLAMTSADLGYSITDEGGEAPSVTLYYGETDGGTTPASWSNSVVLGTKNAGAHVESITGLSEGTSYYYTIAATNTAGTVWGSSASFTTVADTSPKMVRTTVSGVSSSSWTNVDLGKNYNSAVIVATPIYANAAQVPVVTRIRNVSGSSFEVKLDRADGLTAAVSCDVSVIAVEEGVYTLASDGVQMEAVKFTSTVTAAKSSWLAEARSYTNSYTTPVVLGQVMSANDANWSVFWSMGNTRTAPADASNLNIGKHVAEDSNKVRADETIGYIVIEAGTGSINGVAYSAGLGADSIQNTSNNAAGYSYNISGLTSASAGALSSAAMDGNDGGWPVFFENDALSASAIKLIIDEDDIGDSESSHTSEQVNYLIFE